MTTRMSALFGLASVVAAVTVGSSVATAQDAENGRVVFEGTCVACHGADGRGTFEGVPNLSSRLAKSDDELFSNITEGFQSQGSFMAMPARGGNPDLTDQEIHDVIAYIREEFGE